METRIADPGWYQQRDKECISLARNARDDKTRAEYYAQAEHYRRLAEELVRTRLTG